MKINMHAENKKNHLDSDTLDVSLYIDTLNYNMTIKYHKIFPFLLFLTRML